MGTANYNFTYVDPNGKIDVPADTKTFLDEIDGKIHENAAAEKVLLDALQAKFPVSGSDLADGSVTTGKLADKSVTAEKLADGAVTLESLGIAPNTLDGSVIRDGSIGATKLSSTGIDALLSGITIRYFNSTDPAADNVGMDIVDGIEVSGWYIPIWGLVVIPRLSKAPDMGAWSGTNGIKLPSYIPNPSVNINVGYAIRFDNSADFKSWAYMTYNTEGRLEASTQNNADGYITNPLVFFVQSGSAAASRAAYIESNGVL